MGKSRKLVDLYKVGVEVIFEEGTPDEEVVWVQKLIPPETQQALRKANVERSKVLIAKHAEEEDETRSLFKAELERQYSSRDDKITLIASEQIAQAFESAAAEVADAEEWKKDDYLSGLQTAWDEGIEIKIQDGTDDPEAKRVFEELQRYNDQVNENYKKREARIIRDFKRLSESEIDEKAFDALVDAEGTSAWLQEFRKYQVYLATRDKTNHRETYFESRDEIDELSIPVLQRLLQAYQEVEVSPGDAKS